MYQIVYGFTENLNNSLSVVLYLFIKCHVTKVNDNNFEVLCFVRLLLLWYLSFKSGEVS